MAEDYASDSEEVVYAIDEGKELLTEGKVQPIAALEGLLLDPTMTLARDNFCQQHCDKLQGSSAEVEQQTLFGQYQAVMESTFQKQQQQYWTDGPMFTLQELAEQLEGQDNCNEEVCELLRSVTALSAFLGLLEDFQHAETARAADGGPLELQGSKAGLHAEEQEDGEERPDLDLSLNVTTLTPAA